MPALTLRWLWWTLPALCLTALLAWLVWHGQPAPVVPVAANAPATTSSAGGTDDVSPAYWQQIGRDTPFVTGLEALPASLAGTEAPDGLVVDANGNLVVNNALRALFEYFLSAVGEEDITRLIGRIRVVLSHRLPPGAAAQGSAILDRYLAWRAALADIPQAGGGSADTLDPTALQAQQAAIRELRSRLLDRATIDAFFADEDAWDDYALQRMTVMRDSTLSTQQKASRAAELRAILPEHIRSEMAAVSQYMDLQTLTREWQQSGGDAAGLRTLREQLVGAAAADRLEALDDGRAQFETRLTHWLAERDAVRATPGLAAADREAQLDRLRAERFPNEDGDRLRSLEHIADTEGLQALRR